MYRLSFIILFAGLFSLLQGQSPHGEELLINCSECHTTHSWKVNKDSIRFNHTNTNFVLEGQHPNLDCIACHKSMVFTEVKSDCASCHMDMHEQTLGMDCARCHSAENWLVNNISELHATEGFPLLGQHAVANCYECHQTASQLRFERIGNDCINCHLPDYNATTNPNHNAAGYAQDCTECHSADAVEWSATGINHDFFPLTLGHDITDCKECHDPGDYSTLSADCVNCHQNDFDQSINPNHSILGFSTNCAECHTADPGWMPADMTSHDNDYFPIYSGEHQGEWNDCAECHTNPQDYSVFTCIICHTNPETDNDHKDVNGYVFEDNACLACHPTGSEEDNFNHDGTGFPLTGEHLTVDCNQCHLNGFGNTDPTCSSCHLDDYNESTNPNHNILNISQDCALCHSTDPDWIPAFFDVHNDYYVLNGAHAIIKNDCASCHAGDYNNTPNTCAGCHQSDFNQTTNPDHNAAQFSTDCATCHSEDEWTPASFDHDGQYFPIYSGKHQGEWNQCMECHDNPSDYSQFTCVSCHTNPETDNDHLGVNGYSYDNNACLACHPNGDADDNFDHDLTNFPLTGAHIGSDCVSCHANGFAGTPTNCSECHTDDFNMAVNPNHNDLGFSMDCAACHTTDPDWNPALLDNHNNYYSLNGAHAVIQNDCAVCHNGDYNNTPNTCAGCHQSNFNQTTNPDHTAAQFSTDCATCHSEDNWTPASFDHDGQYFPIYSGKHQGEWNQCMECHDNPSDYAQFTCIACHTNPETDNEHNGVNGYSFNNNACLACHPNGDADDVFDHDLTSFPLTGAHIGSDCISCHANGFAGTPTNCSACHTDDFNSAINPNHNSLGFSMDCAACHTTDPDWNPALLDNHNNYYSLNGAHAVIQNDCAACHNGDYNNTPNTCVGCHQSDFNQTTNPDHTAAQFTTDCATCHSEDNWTPASFDHDGQYFPIYSGKHNGEWNQCLDCHDNPSDYSQFTCVSCHQNPETDNEHLGVNGYSYISSACLACHPTGDSEDNFDHNLTNFSLTGAHIQTDCIDCHAGGYAGTSSDCNDCHTIDFNQSTNPNHQVLGLSTDCASCHTTDPGWSPATFADHDNFYALNGAHVLIKNDCNACHTGNYNTTPNTCVGCHQNDYDQTMNPNHQVVQFSTDCITCHTEDEWTPASFDHDGQYFPIYSGKHNGEWNQCIDCHDNPSDYSQFTCISCHQNPETDNEHPGVNGYTYNSSACFACHPTGDGDDNFDHNLTSFALTGAHLQTDCLDCHASGYSGTTTECNSCHNMDFNQSTNPNHVALGFSTDCIICHSTEPDWEPAQLPNHDDFYVLDGAHAPIANQCTDCHQGNYTNTPNTCSGCHTDDFNLTTNPNHQNLGLSMDCVMCHTTAVDWMPASFSVHDNFYVLEGAHAAIANDCATCHQGNYNTTPNTCIGCHQGEFDQTTNPPHSNIGFSSDCASCHTQDAWIPTTYDHDGLYFPVYSGTHNGEWNLCQDCHINSNDYSEFTCISCHSNPATDNEHIGIGGYLYENNACLACHPTGESTSGFDHNTSAFPLTGAHISAACVDCHANGYQGTPTNCDACHLSDFNQSTNPNHNSLGLSLDCGSCHTTDPGWTPASFSNHNNYYPLTGAHLAIQNNCSDCHNGNYNSTPNNCEGCHISDFNQTTNPSHSALGFSTDCASCHSTNPDWEPAAMPTHDNYYPLTGEHLVIQNNCADCHNGNYNSTPNTCDGCHMADYNQSVNPNHSAIGIGTDCIACHTTDPGWMPASFPTHNNYYPLTGGHMAIQNNCADCHSGNYTTTPNTCDGCHLGDYNQTTNPNHSSIGIPTDCEMCHTTDPGWMPADFPTHNNYYPLTGAHIAIQNNCVDCHNGNYNTTPNTCEGCHISDYNQATNPNHLLLALPTDCVSCHTTDPNWTPATFTIHNNYYPLLGAHAAIANQCMDCHNGNYSNTPNTCYGCHATEYNQTTNPNHITAQFSTDCASCHSENAWVPATFDHDNSFFPIYSGKHKDEWNLCIDCHTTGNYSLFSCIDCHEHSNQNDVDDDHDGVSGYTYNSSACLACHPQGD